MSLKSFSTAQHRTTGIRGTIRFGTDGWRGIIADDFTFENVRHVAAAVARYVTASTGRNPLVTVGYDTRFHSRTFAAIVADVLTEGGCRVLLSDTFLSTPALSSSVVDRKAFAGIMISASHNPPEFNGLKFKTSRGCSAPEEVTRNIEQLVGRKITTVPRPRKWEGVDLTADYFRRLRGTVDLSPVRKRRITIVADPMHGAGTGYLEEMLKETSCAVTTIHPRPDPMFGGLHPEPIEEYLGDLKRAVVERRAACGLATDGDADRVGVVDEQGNYLSPHQVFPLLLYHLCHYKKMRGKVVQALSMGYLSERIARDHGLAFEVVPIGFKYIAAHILREEILMGGEESGGYGYGGYLPERDGILNSLMIVEMLSTTGRPLSHLLKEIERKYGASRYLRADFENPGIPKKEFVERVREDIPSRIGGLAIREIKDYDGVKLILQDDSWLLMRPSGTEPIIRVYSESESIEKTRRLISWGRALVNRLKE